MSRISKIRGRMIAEHRAASRRVLISIAKSASHNAKRSSIALEIPFEIIKDGGIYQVFDGSMIKTASLRKAISDKSGLTKGSRICLK